MKYDELQFGQSIQNRGLVLNKLDDGKQVRDGIKLILSQKKSRGRKPADPLSEMIKFIRD